jgi:hypothetical protein
MIMRWTAEQREGFGRLIYIMQKQCLIQSTWLEYLDAAGLTESDWREIKDHLLSSYGIKTYV